MAYYVPNSLIVLCIQYSDFEHLQLKMLALRLF